jgi:lipopolysaccharide transport system permease protein
MKTEFFEMGCAVKTEAVLRIDADSGGAALTLKELWEFRELLYFLVWRDIKVRYKQTVLGAAWAVVQPLTTMVVFTLLFGKVVKVPSDGLPYSIFAFTALLPWTYFSQAVNRSTASLVSSAGMIKKVYFPRLIVPIASAVAPVVDFAIAFLVLLGMMAWFRIAPSWSIVALPIFMLLALMTALAVGLFTSALNVRYRDVGHAIPFLTQIWMFATPVLYPVSMIPEKWRALYSMNPMSGVIEGFRWALLGKQSPDFYLVLISTAAVVLLLVSGMFYFKRVERLFADVI